MNRRATAIAGLIAALPVILAAPATASEQSDSKSSGRPSNNEPSRGPATAHAVQVDDLEPSMYASYASIPFGYVLDFTKLVDGRAMNSSPNKTYCNYFKATSAPGTSVIYIQLKHGGTYLTKVSYPTDGKTYRYCWTGVGDADWNTANYFKYTKADDGRRVQGSGEVRKD